jgi:hypothetical protein
MNSTPHHEFAAGLAAHAAALDAGPAPVERVLAGARRRAVRRRAATAVVGVVVLVGAAGGLGIAFGGSHGAGTHKVPPGQRSNPVSPRHEPVVTQQDGLAPGQKAWGSDPVVASGTEDGVPWQVTVKVKPDASLIAVGLWLNGVRADFSTEGADSRTPPLKPPMGFEGADGTDWIFLVPDDAAVVAWTGTDGFRHDTPTLPARSYGPLGDMRLAVFPSSRMNAQPGDEFVGYDAAGRQLQIYWSVFVPH